MRRSLAAIAVAALPLTALAGPASAAAEGSCLDPLFASSAPRFVYYNPEMGFYYVDVAAAQAFAEAQPGHAASAALCLADLDPSSNACARAFLAADYPSGGRVVYMMEGGLFVDHHAYDPFVAALVGNTEAFADCLV